jgi:hypothetical protein
MGTVLLVLKLFLTFSLELVLFLSCLYIVYERYLAAKTGTNLAVLI